MARAYILQWDPTRVWDADFNVWVDREHYGEVFSPAHADFPVDESEHLRLHGVHDVIEGDDYPLSDVGWPIVSRAMVDALHTVGQFEHRAVPIDIVDASKDAPTPRPVDRRFVLLHLTRHVDAIDLDASVGVVDPDVPGRLTAASSVALRDDVPLPPIFRLAAYPWLLLVSAEGRAALEDAGVRGVAFHELDEVDGLAFRAAQMSPWELDAAVDAHRPEDGPDPLFAVIRLANCDRATALKTYWRHGANYFLQFDDEEAVPPNRRIGWRLLQAIERRYTAGMYKQRLLFFDPRADGGVDLTQSYPDAREAAVRAVPRVMLESTGERPAEAMSPGEKLLKAAIDGDRRAAQEALMAGADTAVRDEDGGEDTPLHLAVRGAHRDVVQVLLDHQPELEARNRLRHTPLHVAAVAGNAEIVHMLLDDGADIDAEAVSDRPIDLALRRGQAEVVDTLLRRGARVDCEGQHALHAAVQGGDVDVLARLLDEGAPLDDQDARGETPLLRAATLGWVPGAKLLKERGAAMDFTSPEGCIALHLAARGDRPEMVRWLAAEVGQDLAALDARGWTPLVSAVHADAVAAAEVLLELGAGPVDAAIEEAISWDGADVEMVELLLEHGADAGLALRLAATTGHEELVEGLLARGADPDAANGAGETPLHLAAGRGVGEIDESVHAAMVTALLRAGADPTRKDRRGATALHHAAEARLIDVARTLLDAGCPRDARTTTDVLVDFETPLPPGATARDVAQAAAAEEFVSVLDAWPADAD